jgi:mannose-6-phosphate isomerase-like protein (cupin superfamily)
MVRLILSVAAVLLGGVQATTLAGDSAQVLPKADVQAQTAKVIAATGPTSKDAGTAVLGSYGNLTLRLYVRRTAGGGEVHKHFDDLMIVQQGTATLVTGGTLADPKELDNGEIRGSKVVGGVSRKLSPGDIAIIPAGVAHQTIIEPGSTYAYLVAKVHEP